MAVGSLVLAALSFVSMGLGVLTTPVPLLGAIFSFAAPTLALAGVITGGVAMSRARRAGRSSDLALAGAVANGLCFVPALITALTCGVCNALCSTGRLETRREFRWGVQTGGASAPPAHAGQPAPEPAPGPPPAPSVRREGERDAGQRTGDPAPPPAFPPPPIEQRPP